MNSKISFVCKVFGIVFAGLLGVYFMCSGHNHEQAILQNAKVCFEEALQEEKKKLEGEKKKLQKEIDNIKQSKAYRLGNKLLWLPRKVVKRG